MVRCANGLVAFRTLPRASYGVPTHVYCLNDRSQFVIAYGPPEKCATDMLAMFTHAVQLKGAIQQVVELSIP